MYIYLFYTRYSCISFVCKLVINDPGNIHKLLNTFGEGRLWKIITKGEYLSYVLSSNTRKKLSDTGFCMLAQKDICSEL